MNNLTGFIALITIIVWPVVPLFWIPVHGASRFFKKLGLLTYIMPPVTWLPLTYIIYRNRATLLQYKVYLPAAANIIGLILLISGAMLHIWTGKLLGLWGLMGLPEISSKVKSRLVAEGPFSLVRHPTYLAHTLLFSGVFYITGVMAVAIITVLDFILINALIIPLEEKELSKRFGEKYEHYKKKVGSRFFPGIWIIN